MIEIEIKLQACTRYDDAAGVYVSWCPALDIHSQGETADEAKRAIEGAVMLFLKYCYNQQILDDTRGPASNAARPETDIATVAKRVPRA